MVVWSELLETSNIDLDDDYFGLGGYSLQVVNMVIRIHEELGVELPITIVFDYPTIRELAHHIESELLEATA